MTLSTFYLAVHKSSLEWVDISYENLTWSVRKPPFDGWGKWDQIKGVNCKYARLEARSPNSLIHDPIITYVHKPNESCQLSRPFGGI